MYSQSAVKMIIQYAHERGVRVIPEFDVPGNKKITTIMKRGRT